jgi:signal transduction histidine kinase/CheY-like chemotaxis protein/sugar lactone lactonase YvrE
LDRYDPKTETIQPIKHPALNNISVFGIAEDDKTNIWLATWNGLFKYDRKSDRLLHFDAEKTLPHNHVWTIIIDSEQRIWAGTEGGGIAILKEGNDNQLHLVKQLQHDGTTHQSISDNRIYSIFEDGKGGFWIGTGNGLDYYNWQTNTIKHLSQQSELWPKGTIAGITEDQKGFIWLSHKQGLSRINTTDLTIRTFSKQDGLQSNEFTEGAVYRSNNDILYFGGNAGVNYFSPDSIRTNPIAPKVVLTELRILNEVVEVDQTVNGRIVLDKPLYLTPAINLTHDDKSISIEFAALHYANPIGNKYAYKLEGFDKDWIYTDASKRVASYSNLVPGKYLFQVKASNSDGIWTETPVELHIDVSPAIWASTGAYLLYTAIILFLLYAFFYYITRYTRIKSKMAYETILHKKELELHENKVQFFTNISHEIKTPLSLILSPIQLLKDRRKDDVYLQAQLQTMESNGNRLLKTVHQLLDIRRFETGHEILRVNRTDIIALVRKTVESFSQEAKQRKIQLKVDTLFPSLFVELDSDKIEKVLYNLLSNAFKFTERGGTIKVRIRKIQEQLCIDVMDNGAGISVIDLDRIFKPFLQGKSSAPGGSGLGLTYSKSLVEMHGGTLSVQSRSHSNEFKLTVFRISLSMNAITRQSIAETDLSIANKIDHENASSLFLPPLHDAIDYTLPRRCTILFVEDNDEMRRYLVNFFAPDYDTLEAENGEKGLLLAKQYVPDLIISDVMMPKLDGLSFVQMVKSDILLRHIPVILLTARSLMEYEMEGLVRGADDYMVKPFHLPILALKVRNQLLACFRMQEKLKTKISVEPTKLDIQCPDEHLLQKVMVYIEEHIADTDLKVDNICLSIGLSRAQLYRKIKALTGYTMADMIKEIRLKRANQLLQNKAFQVSEVAYMVGFNDPYYFSKNYKARFGYSPRERKKINTPDTTN